MDFRMLIKDCRCVLWVINHSHSLTSAVIFVNKCTRQLLLGSSIYFKALNCCFFGMYIAEGFFRSPFDFADLYNSKRPVPGARGLCFALQWVEGLAELPKKFICYFHASTPRPERGIWCQGFTRVLIHLQNMESMMHMAFIAAAACMQELLRHILHKHMWGVLLSSSTH